LFETGRDCVFSTFTTLTNPPILAEELADWIISA